MIDEKNMSCIIIEKKKKALASTHTHDFMQIEGHAFYNGFQGSSGRGQTSTDTLTPALKRLLGF